VNNVRTGYMWFCLHCWSVSKPQNVAGHLEVEEVFVIKKFIFV